MKLSHAAISKLPLSASVDAVADGNFDRFPPLIIDRCLTDSKSLVTEQTVALFTAGCEIHTETLTMPRRKFGSRPLTVMPLGARALYTALVSCLAPKLSDSSRDPGKWAAHSAFGLPTDEATPAEYVVQLDIASCYEYVAHDQLARELVVRTMDSATVGILIELLGETFRRPIGLPQMMDSSDLLADAYLESIERSLIRSGFEISRYADDFRVLASDWGTANDAIEEAAEAARGLGLVLSTEKTTIVKASTLAREETERTAYLTEKFNKATDDLTEIEAMMSGYDDFDFVEIAPDFGVAIAEALRRILLEWHADPEDAPREAVALINPALHILESSDPRLSDELLGSIVFYYPQALQTVARYVAARREIGENWETIAALSRMGRQSPWAKIWLFEMSNTQLGQGSPCTSDVLAWARFQLEDKHEVVRAEAAWFLARCRMLKDDKLAQLYARASSISRPAIAAAFGCQGGDAASRLMGAMKSDSSLMENAFEWGARGGVPQAPAND